MKDFTSSIVGLIIVIFQLCLVFAGIGAVQYRIDTENCMNAAKTFIQRVVDIGEVTDNMLDDINISIAGTFGEYDVDISSYVKTTNPVPGTTTNETYVTEIKAPVKRTYGYGDRIRVEVTCIKLPTYISLVSQFVGKMGLHTKPLRFSGFVR